MFEHIVAPANIYMVYNEAAFAHGAVHRHLGGSIVEPYDWHAELSGGSAGRLSGGHPGPGNQGRKVMLDGTPPVPPELRMTARCIH